MVFNGHPKPYGPKEQQDINGGVAAGPKFTAVSSLGVLLVGS